MSLFRIALANLPFPASAQESIELSTQAIERAGAAGARVVCFPECYLPGYRGRRTALPPPDRAFLEQAWQVVAAAAARAKVGVVLGTERVSDGCCWRRRS